MAKCTEGGGLARRDSPWNRVRMDEWAERAVKSESARKDVPPACCTRQDSNSQATLCRQTKTDRPVDPQARRWKAIGMAQTRWCYLLPHTMAILSVPHEASSAAAYHDVATIAALPVMLGGGVSEKERERE